MALDLLDPNSHIFLAVVGRDPVSFFFGRYVRSQHEVPAFDDVEHGCLLKAALLAHNHHSEQLIMRSSDAAVSLIVLEEVSSKNLYNLKYQHPTWPGGASGVTIGIGYDLGYSTPTIIQGDWGDKLPVAMVAALESVAGIHGSAAASHAHELRGVVTVPWVAAMAVFIGRDMPKWEAIVSKTLPNTENLAPDSFGALVSLAYNRGPSFSTAGDRYREMRAIRDHLANQQFSEIPDDIRSMVRLWPNVVGLRNRRDHEAALFEKGLAS